MPIKRYKTLDINNGVDIEFDWGRAGGNLPKSPMHSIASYLAMFAPALPEYFINLYSKKGDLVMDPFSGRGTTGLRSREMKRDFVGSDLNPYSLVLSRSKFDQYKKNDLLKRINELEVNYKNWEIENRFISRPIMYSEMKIYYHVKTLKKIIFIRETLGRGWRNVDNIDNAILAFSMGIMHGPTRNDGSSMYFSLDMSNTISMSPEYVRKYAIEHNLPLKEVNVFEKIKDRINSKYDEILEDEFNYNLKEHDSTLQNDAVQGNSVDLVVTSPPYLSIVNYTNSNWLKLWLLGYERKNLKRDIKLSDSLKFDEYIVFITSLLNSLENKVKIGGKVCLIVGDVYNRRLIEEVWETIRHNVNYRFVEIYYDHGYSQKKKVLNTMNNRKGKATMIEKVLVVERIKN
ncbi:MAG: site-specific DNA-methyltransferase [Mollicutes bacterium PWAP]|nr:site-specific DNA-methyltransferase [Mollicutes bacterium PWAP]